MEGIQRLYGNMPTALVRRNAARSAQTQKTSPRTDSFQSVPTETERAEQAAKAVPLPNFSRMTDRQKLSALATLHKEIQKKIDELFDGLLNTETTEKRS